MRLSTVFELLVIALLIAFAASRVIDGPDRSKALSKDRHLYPVSRQSQEPPSRHCTCSSLTCNCCRDFSLPIVPVKGPGCATVSYLRDDAMMITMSFGDRVLRNITVDSKKPKPICMGMPGGISKFCGRLYSIQRDGENFKTCLGLELRALDDVEAALRVSCFKFGPNGVNVEPGEAIPVEKSKEEEEEEDDDYGLGALDDDDDDDDDDFGLTGAEDDDDDDEEGKPPTKDTYNYVDSSDSDADYTGFSSLSEELFGGFFGTSSKKKKPTKVQDEIYVPETLTQQDSKPQVISQPNQPQVNLVVMQPVILPSSKPPRRSAQRKPVKNPTPINPPTSNPVKATTQAPVKRKTTTASPVRTLAPSTPPSPIQENSQPKKKKKKPSRKRTSTSPKPSSNQQIPTTTTMTVNVFQGDLNLNQTKTPASNEPLKIPMSQPIIETKPVENAQQSSELQKVTLEPNSQTSANTGLFESIAIESTTQTIMQNTIPVDEIYNNVDQFPIKNPNNHEKNEVVVENAVPVNTTTQAMANSDFTVEGQASTVQEESTAFTVGNFQNKNQELATIGNSEHDESEDTIDDGITEQNKFIAEGGYESLEPLKTTEPNDAWTDQTEAEHSNNENTTEFNSPSTQVNTQERSRGQGNDKDEDDEDDDEELDIGADLGLDDDDEEEENDEESTQKKPPTNVKQEEKESDDDDDDDILDGLLDDDDEEDTDSKTKRNEEERALGAENNTPYKINPLLYRLARVSSGSMVTGRHLPRFSDGRNRRNNKRMRFAPLELTQ